MDPVAYQQKQFLKLYKQIAGVHRHVTSQWNRPIVSFRNHPFKSPSRKSTNKSNVLGRIKCSAVPSMIANTPEQRAVLERAQSKERLVTDTTQGRVAVLPKEHSVVKEPFANQSNNMKLYCAAVTSAMSAATSNNPAHKDYQMNTWDAKMRRMGQTYAANACPLIAKAVRYHFPSFRFPVPFQKTDLLIWNELLGLSVVNSGHVQIAPRFHIVVSRPIMRKQGSWNNPVKESPTNKRLLSKLHPRTPLAIKSMYQDTRERLLRYHKQPVKGASPVVWNRDQLGIFMMSELMTCHYVDFYKVQTRTDLDQLVCLIRAMHEMGIVHMDLHMDNVMCRASESFASRRWYLNDFGSCIYKPIWWDVLLTAGHSLADIEEGWKHLCKYDLFRLGLMQSDGSIGKWVSGS